MGFGMYSGKSWDSHLPCIHSYEEAKYEHDSIKPIRGRSEDVRPLGKRSADFITIHKVGTSIMPAYAVRLYRTDIVTYHADGRIAVKTGGWDTTATTKALYRVLPTHNVQRVNRHVRVCGYVVTEDEGLNFVPSDTEDMFGYPAWEGYTLLNPKREYVHVINRKAKNAMRKQYKHFFDWYKGYISLRDYRITEGEINEAMGSSPVESPVYLLRSPTIHTMTKPTSHEMYQTRNTLLDMMLSGDYVQYQKAAMWLHRLHYNGVFTPEGSRNWYGARNVNNLWECKPAVKKAEELLVLLYAPDILDIKPVPYTQPARDKFAKWMNGWINKIPTNRTPTLLPEDASLDKVK